MQADLNLVCFISIYLYQYSHNPFSPFIHSWCFSISFIIISHSRGKRIHYHGSEDLLNTGNSSFTLLAPNLLFPSLPSHPPRLELMEPSGSNSQLADLFETPRPIHIQNVLPTPQNLLCPRCLAFSTASQDRGAIAKSDMMNRRPWLETPNDGNRWSK